MEEENKNIPVVDNTIVEDNVPEPENSAPEEKPDSKPEEPEKTEETQGTSDSLETKDSEETPKPEPEVTHEEKTESSEPLVASASNALPKAETKFEFNSADLKVPDSPLATPEKAKNTCCLATVLLALIALLGLAFGGIEYYVHEVDPSSPLAKIFSGTPANSDSDKRVSDLTFENSKLRADISLLETLTRATVVEVDDEDNPGQTMGVAEYLSDLAPETSLKSPDFGLALDLPDAASLTAVYTVSPAGEKPNALSGTLALSDAAGTPLATLYRYYVESNPEYAFDYAGTCDAVIGEVGSVQIVYNYCVKFADDIPADLKAALSDPENYYQL